MGRNHSVSLRYSEIPVRFSWFPDPTSDLDILLLEPFVLDTRQRYPDATLAMLTTIRLTPLVERLNVIDVILHTDTDALPNVTRQIERLGRDLSLHSFDIALALTYESDPLMRKIMEHTGARVRIGPASLGEEGVSLNVLVREYEPDETYLTRVRSMFSILDVKPRTGYVSAFSSVGEKRGRALDFMRDRHGEEVIGFLFDQADTLDELGSDELVSMTRSVMNRRTEKAVLSGFGLREREVRQFVADGGKYMERETPGDVVELFSDCSWTVTNSLGLAAVIGGAGSRVVYVGKPSRLKKFPLTGLGTVSFLPVTSGKVLIESLLRVMEEKYPGE